VPLLRGLTHLQLSHLPFLQCQFKFFLFKSVKPGHLGLHCGTAHARRHARVGTTRRRRALPYQGPTGIPVCARRCRQLLTRAPSRRLGRGSRAGCVACKRAHRAGPSSAVAHARWGRPPMPQDIRRGSLRLEAFCTPTCAPAIKRHPRRSSRASPLCRTPLAPPWANTATDRSGRRPTPRASRLTLVWASPVAYSRALPPTSPEFEP
jgi:hypothetical protein